MTSEEHQREEVNVPSVNVQVACAVIGVGLWMVGVNRRLNRLNRGMLDLVEGMTATNYHIGLLHGEALTAKQVLCLAMAEKGA